MHSWREPAGVLAHNDLLYISVIEFERLVLISQR